MFTGYLEAQFTLWRLKYCLITIRNGHRASGVWSSAAGGRIPGGVEKPFLHREKVSGGEGSNNCCWPLTLTVKSKGMIMALLPRPTDSSLKSVRCDFVVDFGKR